MARNPRISLDIEFNEIDQSQIEEIRKRLSDSLRMTKIDPKWTDIQKKLVDAQKNQKQLLDESSKIATKIQTLDEKRANNLEKIQNLHETITKIQLQSTKVETSIGRSRAKIQQQLRDDEKKLAILKEDGLDDEKSKIQAQRLQDRINDNLLRDEELKTKQSEELLSYTEKVVDLNKDINSRERTDVSLNNELNDLYLKRVSTINEVKSANDTIIQAQRKMNSIEDERLATQQAITQELMKIDHSLSYEEAVKQAKKLVPLSEKQSKFEEKHAKIMQQTKKGQKAILKERMNEVKLHVNAMQQDGVGFFERRKFMKQERADALKSVGMTKRASKEQAGMTGQAMQLIGSQGKQMMGILTKLAGPLMALGSIGAFVITMLNYNREIMKARKNLFRLSSTSDDVWNNMKTGTMMGVDDLESYRSNLDSLWGKVGMKYEDALQNVSALTGAGIKLSDVLKNNAEMMANVERMSLLSGESFGEMAAISGEWVTEFRKDTNELMGTFVSLRDSASRTDMTTTRFFSSVMNAAQGLALYGANIEDVAESFADLTRGVKMPQKQAAQLATSMLNAVDSMSASQKVLVSQTADVRSMLELESEQLQKKKAANEASDDEIKRLEQINLLLKQQLNPLNEGVRLFEALDPGKRIEAQIKAMAASAPELFKNIDITDSDALKNVLKQNREEIAIISEKFGLDPKMIRLIEEISKVGTSIGGIGKSITDAEEKKLSKKATQQANIIAQGTKPILDSISENIGKILRELYVLLEGFIVDHMIPFFKMVSEHFSKNYQEAKYQTKILDERLAKMIKERDEMTEEINVIENKKKMSPEDWTPEQEEDLKSKRRERAGLKIRIEETKSSKSKMEDIAKKQSGWFGAKGVIRNALGMGDTEKIQEQSRITWAEKTNELQTKQKDYFKSFDSDPNITTKPLRITAQGLMDEIDSNAAVIKAAQLPLSKRSKAVKKEIDKLIESRKSEIEKAYHVPQYKAQREEAMAMLREFFGSLSQFDTGGYTGDGSSSDFAGIVHKKEFVFDEESTKKIGAPNLEKLMTLIKANKLENMTSQKMSFNKIKDESFNQQSKASSFDVNQQSDKNESKKMPEVTNIFNQQSDKKESKLPEVTNIFNQQSDKNESKLPEITNIFNQQSDITNDKIPFSEQFDISSITSTFQQSSEKIIDTIKEIAKSTPKSVFDQQFDVSKIMDSAVSSDRFKEVSKIEIEPMDAVKIASIFQQNSSKMITAIGGIAKAQDDIKTSNINAIRSNIPDVDNMPITYSINEHNLTKPDNVVLDSQSLINAIEQLTTIMNSTMPVERKSQTIDVASKPINNNVTINVNQRDRQEIEQIIYKVLYDNKGTSYR